MDNNDKLKPETFGKNGGLAELPFCLAVATGNPGKIGQIEEIIADKDFYDEISESLERRGILSSDNPQAIFHFVTAKSLGYSDEPEENGESYEANALIKARAAAVALNMDVIADDSGFELKKLNGFPGIHTARFAPREVANEALLEKMRGVPAEERQATFVCAIAFAGKNGEEFVTISRTEGFLAEEAQGDLGFGFDPIFRLPGSDKTFAMLSDAERSKHSSRGKAIKAFCREYIKRRLTQ